jgi:hypothetical protein
MSDVERVARAQEKATRSIPDYLIKDLPLAYTNIAGGSTNATVNFQIFNPSVLLHLTIQIFARSANLGGAGAGTPAHNYTGETWQLFTAATGTPDVPLNPVFQPGGVPTPQPLPDAYESETGTKLINGTVVLQTNAGNPSDVYILRCIWEPANPLLYDVEDILAELYARCELPRITPVNISS